MKRNYYTIQELMETAVQKAREDPRYAKVTKQCVLDYELIPQVCRYDRLTRCEFDVIGTVAYGTNEGIYGSVFLCGNWAEGCNESATISRFRVYSLKTLRTDKDAYLAMGELVTLISYYANNVVSQNLNRFD